MNEIDLAQIKTILDAALETHLAAIHEDISDVRGELRGDIDGLRDEVRDGFIAVNSKLGGIDNRIDHETFSRNELESRVRRAVPDLPARS